jgi:hypothetical protein
MRARNAFRACAGFRSFEFAFPSLDTLIRVEACAGAALIRASRDTFSAVRKLSFIRELIAEGFIDEACLSGREVTRLRWIVDPGLGLHEPARPADRFIVRTLCGASLVWLILMVLLFLRVL